MNPALVRAASTATTNAQAPVLSASVVAARLAKLVGVQSSALTVQMGSDGQATITLAPALLAKLGLMA